MTTLHRILKPTALLPLFLAVGPSWLPAHAADEPFFSEGFEDTKLLERGWYDGSRFVLSDDASKGKHALQFRFDRGKLLPSDSTGVRRSIEPTEVVSLRVHMKLSPDWSWTNRPYGPHLFLFMTTENGKYDGPAATHLTLYVEPVNGKLRLAAQDIQNKDRPHGLTQGPLRGGYNGQFFDSKDVLFDDGKWHQIDATFKLNSLDLDKDRPNPDGEVRGWVDGKLVIERTDVILRSTDFPKMKFNQFLMLPYFHHGVPHDQTLWIDDLSVGKERTKEGPPPAVSSADRTRLVVLTDISSLTAGEAEPDDGQSLIRLMLYANEFDIEGLIASSNLGHGRKVRTDLIRQVVEAYGLVRPNLLRHDPRYPPADALRETIKEGQPIADLDLAAQESLGSGKDTEASDWIIRVVDRPDPRPVWVIVWGGSADLAQALWKVRETRSPEELERFVAKLRVHAIGDQDSTGPWIRKEFPGLFTITQRRAYRGMYRGGDTALSSSDWVEKHIHGHGPLGDLYPNYRGGDIWSSTLGPVRGIKEGDTPSFLSLVPNGLSDCGHPSFGSWGGRFQGEPNRLTDVPDKDIDTKGDPDTRMSSVYRWRPAFQNDFQARLDWCIKPKGEANHPPTVKMEGDLVRRVKAGEDIHLDASQSTDPDGDELTFSWGAYPADPGSAAPVEIEGQGSAKARVRVGGKLAGRTIPIVVSVSDGGTPKLTRYGRVLIEVERGK